MRIWKHFGWTAACAALGCSAIAGQTSIAPSVALKIYKAGKDVIAPELLPSEPSSMLSNSCTGARSEKVKLSFVVDAKGQPRRLLFLEPAGNEVDILALATLATDRFKPGSSNGIPVAVGQSIEMKLVGCIDHPGFLDGKPTGQLRLQTEPVQKLEPYREPKASGNLPTNRGVTAPYLIHDSDNEFAAEVRKNRVNGRFMVNIVVDANGMPQNPRIVESPDHNFDQLAMETVKKYRFLPAMKDGEPVAVLITIGLN